MDNLIFKRLDEINTLNPLTESPLVKEAGELMELYASGIKQMELLIERYGSSSSPAISQNISFLIGKKTDWLKPETVSLIYLFIQQPQSLEHGETLLNCLTIIRELFNKDVFWEPIFEPPKSLFPFIKHCLDFSQRLSKMIHTDTVTLLGVMCTHKVLDKAFSHSQLGWLNKKLLSFRETDKGFFDDELSDLLDFFKGLKFLNKD
jgi:hypothetical protein